MKKILFLSAFSLVAMIGCKKDDDIGSKPVLTFKSASSMDVPKELQDLQIFFNVKDGDGDLENTWNVVDLYHYPDTTKFDALPFPNYNPTPEPKSMRSSSSSSAMCAKATSSPSATGRTCATIPTPSS